MDNKKLISVRVDPKDLDKLDEFVEKTSYHKRSDFIQAAIKLMLVACEKGKAAYVCRFYPEFGDVVDKFEFGYHRGQR